MAIRWPVPRWALALALVGLGCGTTAVLRTTGGAGGRMHVAPPAVALAPLADGEEEGVFTLEVRGNDSLSGLQWNPGFGSRLDIEERDIDEGWVAGPDGGVIELRYRIGGPPRVRDGEGRETGLPPDDGVLRLFFSEHPTVDVWVEVVW